jgi:hypothetical protein
MRRGSFDFSDEDRERRYENRNRGGQAGRGEETWYREGTWELPADQDMEWRGRGSGQSFDNGPFAGRGPRGYRRSDQAIFEEVCERLTAHGHIDATEVDVEVRQGIVTLTGTAPDRRQKRLAEQSIENISGVQDVSNQLRLAGRGEEQKEERTRDQAADEKAERPKQEQGADGPRPEQGADLPTPEQAAMQAASQRVSEPKPDADKGETGRQPVGVMDETRREQQSEMTAPRSASALDRADASQPDGRESMSGDGAHEMVTERESGETASDRRPDVTAGQPATRELRINAGSPVYGREGDKIGEVAEGTGDYFVVHKGLIFATELYFPAASIIRSDENGVQVDISKEELANYKERPTTVPT